MALGQYLVRELGFEEGVDTLGRWMAHYLAEFIDQAENGSTPTKRVKARKEAVETILRIWEHRKSIPGNIYPLTKYDDVLKGINRLQPKSGMFGYFERNSENKMDQLAAALFNDFSRLNIALLLMKIPSSQRSKEIDSTAVKKLSDTEKQISSALQEWEEFFEPMSKSVTEDQKNKRTSQNTEVDFNQLAIQLIEKLINTLPELKSELQGNG